MKPSFPDIPLSPVNRQAANLLAASDPQQINDSAFKLELQKECDELALSITSMEGQLATFQGEPNEWFRQCRYNLEVATKKLKTNRHTVTMLTRMASEISAHKAATAKAEAETAKANSHAKQCEIAMNRQREITKRLKDQQKHALANAVAKTERHAASMNQERVFLQAFRRATKEKYGPEVNLELIQKADAILATGWLPT